eukprot:862164-Amphidinium_carterae.1
MWRLDTVAQSVHVQGKGVTYQCARCTTDTHTVSVLTNPEQKTSELGSGYPTLATLQANSSSAGLSSTPTLGTSS